jgi:hypothetical protein
MKDSTNPEKEKDFNQTMTKLKDAMSNSLHMMSDHSLSNIYDDGESLNNVGNEHSSRLDKSVADKPLIQKVDSFSQTTPLDRLIALNTNKFIVNSENNRK